MSKLMYALVFMLRICRRCMALWQCQEHIEAAFGFARLSERFGESYFGAMTSVALLGINSPNSESGHQVCARSIWVLFGGGQ